MSDLIDELPRILAEAPGPTTGRVASIRQQLDALAAEEAAASNHERVQRFGRSALGRGGRVARLSRRTKAIALWVAVAAAIVIVFLVPLPSARLERGSPVVPGTSAPIVTTRPAANGVWRPFADAGKASSEVDAFSCLDVSWCIVETGDLDQAALELWNGHTLVATSTPAGVRTSTELSFSCLSVRFCAAVGFNGRPFMMIWNGSTWSYAEPSGVPSGGGASALNGVSCTATNSCIAVGEDADGALVASWDGHRWSTSTDRLYGSPGSWRVTLFGVSCFAASDCLAVGSTYIPDRGTEPVTEALSETGWSMVPNPYALPPGRSNFAELTGLSCASPRSCLAVGDEANRQQTLAEGWDGQAWAVLSELKSRGPTVSESFGGVSCPTTGFCIAVGGYMDRARVVTNPDNPPVGGPIAVAWIGSRWIALKTPPVGGYASLGLGPVECLTPSTCVALAQRWRANGSDRPTQGNSLEIWVR